jgi:hypothetical protein
MLQDLVARIQAGTVNNADYGGFQNLQELVSVIEATAGALNDLRNVTNGVTAALNDVPAGFKLALAEFDAQDPQQRPQIPDIPTYVPPARTYPSPPLTPPWQPPVSTYAPDTLTVTPPVSGGDTHVYFTVESGAISIDPTNKNAAEIGQESLDGLKSLAGQKLGNRARWTDL